jgi:radical SAM superfamily enzyme YgiQ (UPF0313 family)
LRCASTNTRCATGWQRKPAAPISPSVEGLVWRRTATGEIISNKQREAIQNLDELPFVSEVYKRFLHTPDYFYGHSLWPLVVFDTSRGCPYHCSFCVYPQTFSGHKMRYRSVANVADEFDFVSREMPEIKTVMLEDDTFIISKPRTLELAQRTDPPRQQVAIRRQLPRRHRRRRRTAFNVAQGRGPPVLRRVRERRRGSHQWHEEEQR